MCDVDYLSPKEKQAKVFPMVGSLVQRTKCQHITLNAFLMEHLLLMVNLVMISNSLIVLRLAVIQVIWAFSTENIPVKMDA